ncbi:hypothetical protein WOLCODRAFT_27078 [Wolfiporia cocos MD-104 SS10]|uniref:Uncharacterized protein n=1 Tax=Wolfiporia cocos (strain MD-104) TaxID=742152 RepID=A0A2H3K6X0_WOLCO|nr:hypothetical protein WOLCODRAFT_27078 [Wolfiporia cocos MD-104 SS10]
MSDYQRNYTTKRRQETTDRVAYLSHCIAKTLYCILEKEVKKLKARPRRPRRVGPI